MSTFSDTSKWRVKNDFTLLYDRSDKEAECVSKPVTVYIELDDFSLTENIMRNVSLDDEDLTVFDSHTQIHGRGRLDGCYIHVISLNEIPNKTFSNITVSISPLSEERLKTADTTSKMSFFDDRPENGWFPNELGHIFFLGEGEFTQTPNLNAILYISDEKFTQLSNDLRRGGISNIRLEVIADLYQFEYETMGTGMHGHHFNYAFLREERGNNIFGEPSGDGGESKARLEEVRYSWSSVANPLFKQIDMDDLDDEEDDLEEKTMGNLERLKSPFEREQLREFSSIKEEVGKIRNRIDTFYTALIFLCIVVAIQQVTTWFG